MKFQTWITLGAVAMAVSTHAGLYTETYSSGFAAGGYIPDGSTAGWSDTRNVTDVPSGATINGVTVTLNISGGYNGDLYGYLSHNGQLLVLLNRVGMNTGNDPVYSFGYADAGFNNVTLADGAAVNIHNYGGGVVPSGTYAPDSGGLTFAGTYGGSSAGGNWTLFLSDLSSGGGQSQLTGWSLGLDISAVPEPSNVALLVFGGLAIVGTAWRHCRRDKTRSL